MLFSACTVHKVQSLSLKPATASFNLEKQKTFNQRQMYVALGRVTKTDNFFLVGNYNNHAFQVNRYAASEYNRLRESSSFTPLNTVDVTNRFLTILLINTKSLK